MLAFLQLGCQPLVLAFAQQIPADGGRIQVSGIQINQRLFAFLRARGINAFGFRPLEGIIHLARGKHQPAHRAVTGQFLPGFLFKGLFVDGRQRRTGSILAFNHAQFHCHAVGGAHDHFIDHHHGNCGTGQSVNGYFPLCGGPAHGYPLIGLEARVLVGKGVHFAFGYAHQENGFVVVDYLGGLDGAFGIQHHHGIDRLA